MSSDAVNVKELGEAQQIKTDEFIRTLIGQMFEADNDTTFLKASMDNPDGSQSEVEFEIRLVSINGIKTRDGELS